MPHVAALTLVPPLTATTIRSVSVASFVWACAIVFSIAYAVAPTAARAQNPTTIYSFAGSPDGAVPYAPLIRDAQGNLYGTTGDGGIAGTVFKIDSQGVETLLHSFGGPPDGGGPFAGLVRDSKGNLYGTTSYGGSHNLGTVFEITSAGEERVLHSFKRPDGATPFGGLTLDPEGNLYGTTVYGGAGSCPYVGTEGCGTVFVLTPEGIERVLYSFQGGEADGNFPSSTLVRDAAGNLYGTTTSGGCPYELNCGTVFEILKGGGEKVLHRFGGSNDGTEPNGVIFGPGGNLFGTTVSGGDHGLGTVFGATLMGDEKVLYSFGGFTNDGTSPGAGLLWDGASTFYGTTEAGGTPGCLNGCGTIFKVNAAGEETVEYSFGSVSTGGFIPFATLIRDKAGNLYGTTGEGGPSDNGTAFRFTP
jgi:uncharacterized repeat protein (TIGR03803 family)